jgi:predicted DNA binding CopG/RHH family protein
MKRIPKHKSEDKEREFLADTDSTQHVDRSRAHKVTPRKLKPSLKTISLRLPEMMLAELKLLAEKRNVPHQSLIKIFLAERLEQELDDSEVIKEMRGFLQGIDTHVDREGDRV